MSDDWVVLLFIYFPVVFILATFGFRIEKKSQSIGKGLPLVDGVSGSSFGAHHDQIGRIAWFSSYDLGNLVGLYFREN